MDTKLLHDLSNRQTQAMQNADDKKTKERHAKGILSARERVNCLIDNGSFQESGMHITHRCTDFGMDKKNFPGDGVVTGIGTIFGKHIGVASQDFTVVGGSLGRKHADKICETLQTCIKNGFPFIAINDSGGARIQEGVESLSGYGDIFFNNVRASGVIPQISVICGPCAGGAAYSPALCDFIIMTRTGAFMFICGPEVIKAATYQNVTMDDVGSPDMHASVSGNVHFVVNTDAEAMALVKRLLSFLPSNNMVNPPHNLNYPLPVEPISLLNDIIPNSPNASYNIKDIILNIVDDSDFLEIHEHFAPNFIVGLCRIGGIVTGILANQPAVKAGTLDIDAADKAARFIQFCNAFSIPLLTFVDTPGFLPGLQQERGGIIRHGAKLLYAYSASTVPKITVILRKAYGGAYIAMSSKHLGSDAVFAWPTCEIAVMGAEQAVRILYRKELDNCPDGKEKQAILAEQYRERFSSPYQAASLGFVGDVIAPANTRQVIARALRSNLTKRVSVEPKKSGNIPL